MLTLGNLNAVTSFIIGQAWLLVFTIIYLKADLPVWFGIGYFFIGGYRLCRSMVLAIARTFIHPRQTGLAYGMVETVNSVAVILAPILAGYIYDQNPYLIYRISIVMVSVVIAFNILILVIMKRNGKNEPQNSIVQ